MRQTCVVLLLCGRQPRPLVFRKRFGAHDANVPLPFAHMPACLVLRSLVPIAACACACSFCTRCFEGHDDWVRGVIAHPDGTMLASCSSDHVRVLGRTAPHLTRGVGRPTRAQPCGVEPQACASVPCQCWVGCADDPSVERCGWRMCQHVPRARPRGRGDRLLGPPIRPQQTPSQRHPLPDEAAQQHSRPVVAPIACLACL